MYLFDNEENRPLQNISLSLKMRELVELRSGIDALLIGRGIGHLSLYDTDSQKELILDIEGNAKEKKTDFSKLFAN